MSTCRFNKKLILFTIIVLISFGSACTRQNMLEYYTNKNNYVSATGTIHHIRFADETYELYLGISEQTPKFDDTNFVVSGQNMNIVQEHGIENKLQIGDKVSFVAAPKYWGDGYAIPIVEITLDGETLLTFEEGYENLLEWLR